MQYLSDNSSIGRFSLSEDRSIALSKGDRTYEHELNNCWIERPVFDFEFETYEAYLERTQ